MEFIEIIRTTRAQMVQKKENIREENKDILENKLKQLDLLAMQIRDTAGELRQKDKEEVEKLIEEIEKLN